MVVEMINAGGELRPFLFSGGAMLSYEQQHKENFNAAWNRAIMQIFTFGESGDVVVNMAGFSIYDFSRFFHAGFAWGAKKQGVEFTASLEDVADWIIEDAALIEALINHIGNALGYLSEPDKKKAAPKKQLKAPTKKA